MKLSDTTVNILKNFSSINSSLLVRPGNILRTISSTKTVMVKANIQENFDTGFAIYDMSSFLSVYSLYKNTYLDFTKSNKYVVIRDENDTTDSVEFYFADPEVVVKPIEKDFNFADSDIKFNIKKEALQNIFKITNILGLPEIAIIGDGTDIIIQSVDSKSVKANLYKKIIGKTTSNFTAYFKAENLNKIFLDDYSVEIKTPKHTQKNAGIALFKTNNIEYWIIVESNSTF